MKKVKIKTPLTYYGGKQKMAADIIRLMPVHSVYVEPFIGGGAVLWMKPPSKHEIINDHNRVLIEFYKQLKGNYNELETLIKQSLHSRFLWQEARTIYNNPNMFSPLKMAWAVWMLSAQSFGGQLGSGWAYDLSGKSNQAIKNKISDFSSILADRLKGVEIECYDAIKIIQSRDSTTTFQYQDPPYFNSEMGHYNGYTKQNFTNLLECDSKLEGYFLLSSYPSDILNEYIERYGWYTLRFEKELCMGKKWNSNRRKIEVLTANYPLPGGQKH